MYHFLKSYNAMVFSQSCTEKYVPVSRHNNLKLKKVLVSSFQLILNKSVYDHSPSHILSIDE